MYPVLTKRELGKIMLELLICFIIIWVSFVDRTGKGIGNDNKILQ